MIVNHVSTMAGARSTVRALALATIVWPVSPVFAQDGVLDLEALQQRHEAQISVTATAPSGSAIVGPQPTDDSPAPASVAAPTEGFAAAHAFPDDLDGLLALVEAEIAARPAVSNGLASSCAVVAELGGTGPLWQEYCGPGAGPEEEEVQ
ncbi:hypothetical protein JQT66_19050 [Sulfitobacter mediterraneus]|uniref:hypothetical protein n=1 Tax=Sulfitobacter mediterraneus TaxID=83219 RepID=UPI001932D4F2|nr:hypothetical protein [Sulfitobacter mediterraneus]MBM1312278.1 hypothetical protein [Sulfitobacter mediterraneus]MBM1316156.1 hypothetical protein [Sulfitobacter mediterraneus]MBM1324521.1 hypothetical protein [Sulfitobacter mediterraneus]MBM1328432.1 hypothetical protein [Sulfitobacter mediterraneus]MBM1399782.1 hypothetical protein [Sulfitobacter mediterraneus]